MCPLPQRRDKQACGRHAIHERLQQPVEFAFDLASARRSSSRCALLSLRRQFISPCPAKPLNLLIISYLEYVKVRIT